MLEQTAWCQLYQNTPLLLCCTQMVARKFEKIMNIDSIMGDFGEFALSSRAEGIMTVDLDWLDRNRPDREVFRGSGKQKF